MVAFRSILLALSFFGLFFGLFSSLSFDLLKIVAEPMNQEHWKGLLLDLARTLTNSQQEISRAANEFKNVKSVEYGNYLIARIVGGCLITLVMIYFTYRIFRFFLEAPSPSTKILFVLMSVFVVYLIGVIASIIVGTPNFIPYKGFVDLIRNRQYIVNFLLEHYQR